MAEELTVEQIRDRMTWCQKWDDLSLEIAGWCQTLLNRITELERALHEEEAATVRRMLELEEETKAQKQRIAELEREKDAQNTAYILAMHAGDHSIKSAEERAEKAERELAEARENYEYVRQFAINVCNMFGGGFATEEVTRAVYERDEARAELARKEEQRHNAQMAADHNAGVVRDLRVELVRLQAKVESWRRAVEYNCEGP